MYDPIHQFRIESLIPIHIGGLNLSFTNSALFMTFTVIGASAFLILSTRGRGLVPSRWQSAAELTYEFIAQTLRKSAGSEGMKFFPFVFSIFMFVFLGNMWGMFPYFFEVTAQIIITGAMAIVVILLVVVVGFMKHGLHFLKLFVPSGVPSAILPFMVVIEVISFLSRPVSLSIRLFANMLAGHITLKVFAGFVTALGSIGVLGWFGALFPLIMVIALTALEFLVAALQAYVFAILTSLYLNDALHPSH